LHNAVVSVLAGWLCAAVHLAVSGPLLNPGENQKGVDAERLAALERNAPAFIILDFRYVW
jgi:hypothetical protein